MGDGALVEGISRLLGKTKLPILASADDDGDNTSKLKVMMGCGVTAKKQRMVP